VGSTVTSSAARSTGIAAGCAFALLSALVACILLVLNGGLVWLVYLEVVESQLSEGMRESGIPQFALFVGPVVLLVLQWLAFDFLVGQFRRQV
jgi:hypothetical protein